MKPFNINVSHESVPLSQIVTAKDTYPQHVILLLTLCLFTDFCSGDHRPKNVKSAQMIIVTCGLSLALKNQSSFIVYYAQDFKIHNRITVVMHSPKSPEEQEASW